MKLNEKNIFLIDGVGALLSAAFTGFLLPRLFNWVGLAPEFLYGLALLPLSYSIYSLSCFWLVKTIKPLLLKIIIAANLFYCVVSAIIIFTFQGLTNLGQTLLAGEILIILGVVALEFKIYKKTFVT